MAGTPLIPGDLLTVRQALQLLPVSRAMFYRLIDSGQIPSYLVASVGSSRGRLLVRRSDLEEFVSSQKVRRRRQDDMAEIDALIAKFRRP